MSTDNTPATVTTELADDGVRIIHESPHNMLVELRAADGSKEHLNVAKNARNELLYKHGMAQLVHGEPGLIVQFTDDVEVQTTDEGGVYVIRVADREPVYTAPENERAVLEAVRDLKEDGDPEPLEELHRRILDTQIRRYVVNQLLDVPPFETLAAAGVVERDERGWLFHDKLLLTWDGEFRNDTRDTAYSVAGSGVREVESVNEAFTLRRETREHGFGLGDDEAREVDRHTVEIDGEQYTFGKEEVRFVAKALWAAKRVRPRGGAQ